ncbi:MAG: cytochrome-c oxidase [Candidatus Dadabacteria bacterium]|nr:MAG: cytochrome-c oxidase [Candidatus Dadabacteria bacterium]
MNDNNHDEPGHVVPYKMYVRVLVALLILTVTTVWVAQYDFGVMNVVVAMVIASIKAMLVALFFMHLKYENPLTWGYAIFPLILLTLLIGMLFLDNPFRVS